MKPIYYYNHGKQRRKTLPNLLIDEAGTFPFLSGKSLRIFFFSAYWEKYRFWFRFFGYGIMGKSLEIQWKIYFSERNGYRKVYKLWGWKFELLK